ncbi:BlaI/MecI/CopY family transcriptional regulator [bacterium]|nr:BlaI/MecI/CopY family transcriptional regulator [bacterium]
MARKESRHPTEMELAILKVLWQHGPATVRDVHESLDRETGYTTTLKQLQIMTEKGLVVRDTVPHRHVYRAKANESRVTRRLVSDLIDRVFNGSAVQAAASLIETEKSGLTPEDLDRLSRLIDEARKEGR